MFALKSWGAWWAGVYHGVLLSPYVNLYCLNATPKVLYETRLTIYFLMKMKSDSACEEPHHTSRTTQNKRTKENNKNPYSSSFTFFVAQNTLLLLVIYGGKCGLLQKMAGNWELQCCNGEVWQMVAVQCWQFSMIGLFQFALLPTRYIHM